MANLRKTIAVLILAVLASNAAAQLTDSERRTLESFKRQLKAYQPVAVRGLQAEVRDLQKSLREVSRNRELSRSERDRQSEGIKEEIDIRRGMIDDIRKGELILTPEFDFKRMRIGDFGTLVVGKQLNGEHLEMGRSKWRAREEQGGKVICSFDAVAVNGFNFTQGSSEAAKKYIFEVIAKPQNPDKNARYPYFKLRVVDIIALMDKSEAGEEQAEGEAANEE